MLLCMDHRCCLVDSNEPYQHNMWPGKEEQIINKCIFSASFLILFDLNDPIRYNKKL